MYVTAEILSLRESPLYMTYLKVNTIMFGLTKKGEY